MAAAIETVVHMQISGHHAALTSLKRNPFRQSFCSPFEAASKIRELNSNAPRSVRSKDQGKHGSQGLQLRVVSAMRVKMARREEKVPLPRKGGKDAVQIRRFRGIGRWPPLH